ncbi:hypothetical protein [Beijerinckia sp. L45]|uniref:hypothetical protein n=1 Tax=Beijerinckia sp. L45 TaxID=1641855 RepID=UPI00131B26D2|nr:hypothetical protein [Beijerinckia sp. L45]
MRSFVIAILATAAVAAPACAEDYGQYPAPVPFASLPQSRLTGDVVIMPPYGPLPVRVYTTPPNAPFYNVPPYRVIAPY